MEYSPKKMQDMLQINEFKFKKNFGQNFIIDKNVIDNIINKAGIDDKTLVLEIGPGAGSLTCGLAVAAKNVLCYEIDTTLKPILSSTLNEYNNVEIIYQDFLNSDVKEDIKKYNYDRLYVVANLPYYITTPIINKIIDDDIDAKKIVIMVQKEVGDRFKANPGTKDYNSLSIFLKYYFDINKILDISRNVFMPKPNVDSIVLEFVKKNDKINVKDEAKFFKLVKDSFKQKRKNLRNNLKEYDLVKIENILSKYDMDLSIRAEQISIDIFADISNNI